MNLSPCIWQGKVNDASPLCLLPSYEKFISLPLVFQNDLNQTYDALLQWYQSTEKQVSLSSFQVLQSFPLQRNSVKTVTEIHFTVEYIQFKNKNSVWNPETEVNQFPILLDGLYFTNSVNTILCQTNQFIYILAMNSFASFLQDAKLLKTNCLTSKFQIQFSTSVMQQLLQSKSFTSWKQSNCLYPHLQFMRKIDQFLQNILQSSTKPKDVSWIFITGKSACGKTTAVKNSLLSLNDSFVITEPVESLHSLLEFLEVQKKIIILFDENELRDEFSSNSHFLSNWNSKLKPYSQTLSIFCIVITSNLSLLSSITISQNKYIFGHGNHYNLTSSNKEWQLKWEEKMNFLRHLFRYGTIPLQNEQTIESMIHYLENNPKILFTETKTVGDLMEFYRFCMWKWQTVDSNLQLFLPLLQEFRNIHKNLLASNSTEEVEDSSLTIEDETLSIQKLMSWEAIGGNEEIKQKMEQIIEWPILYKQSFTKLNLISSNATMFGNILFYGPPGCAKTTMFDVRTMASQLYHKRLIKRFFSVNAAKLFSKFLGESEEYLRKLFAIMRQDEEEGIANLLFIDEIDTIVCNREVDSSDGGSGRILSTLLNELDGIQKQGSHIFICSTNRPDMIDSALLRPGRIDHLIFVGPPSVQQRYQILEVYSKQIQEKDKADLQRILWNIAWKTDLYTGADLEAVTREALLQFYVRNDGYQTLQRCFENAVQMVKPTVNPEMLQMYTSFQQKV